MPQLRQRFHENFSADRNGAPFTLDATYDRYPPKLHLHASGDFGGGQLNIEYHSNNGVWRETAHGPFTGPVDIKIEPIIDAEHRAVLSDSTSPTLYCELAVVGEGDIVLNF